MEDEKGSYGSDTRFIGSYLLLAGGKPTNMPHVNGIGYGVHGYSILFKTIILNAIQVLIASFSPIGRLLLSLLQLYSLFLVVVIMIMLLPFTYHGYCIKSWYAL